MGGTIKKIIEKIIFVGSKWLIVPFLLYLFVTLGTLLWALWSKHGHVSNEEVLETVEAVDIVLLATLVKMILTGGYTSFVSKNHDEETEKVSSGMLKVKMSTSIVGVSSIHLLKTFLAVEHTDWDIVWKQIAIHGVLIIGSLAFSFVDFIHHKGDALHAPSNNPDPHKH